MSITQYAHLAQCVLWNQFRYVSFNNMNTNTTIIANKVYNSLYPSKYTYVNICVNIVHKGIFLCTYWIQFNKWSKLYWLHAWNICCNIKYTFKLGEIWYIQGLFSHSVSQDYINSFRPGDAILRHRSGSTLAQVMASCLQAPSHYLHSCLLIISKVVWHSSEGNFIRDTFATIH